MPKKKNKNSDSVLIPKNIFELRKMVANGNYHALHHLGEVYELGRGGVKPDAAKAIEFYHRFYEIHMSKRVKVDEISLLMRMGHLHMELGNKYRAAEQYFKAGLQIMHDFDEEKERKRLFKKHKVQKFLEKTGYQDII